LKHLKKKKRFRCPIKGIIYLYNIPGWSSFSSIRPVVHFVIHSSFHPSKAKKREEEEDDSWRRQHIRTQSLASVIFAKSIQTFGREITSMEQYTHQDPQPMNKAKMRNVLKRNKLEED
jgi:hypothetical protein